MEVKTYMNNSEAIRLNKNLTEVSTLSSVRLLENCSLLNPSFVFKMPENLFINYIYVPKFGRYYYINNMTILDNNMVQIDCSVDVLMSFKDEIRNTKQHIVRQENEYNMYMIDGRMAVLQKIDRQTLNFKPPEGGWVIDTNLNVGNARYVLNCVGGEAVNIEEG